MHFIIQRFYDQRLSDSILNSLLQLLEASCNLSSDSFAGKRLSASWYGSQS
jgi:hypothetical protein